jgi:mannose-6-phosphate isomerase-like protein (cupin superfamily)
MRTNSHELPIAMEQDGVISRQAQWGEMNVAVETAPAGMDTRPLFAGLPHDSCQCPHWGYVVRGRARVVYADREEVLSAGDVYYLSPGHNLICEEDGELIEFSPKGKYQETMEAVARNAQQRDAVTASA